MYPAKSDPQWKFEIGDKDIVKYKNIFAKEYMKNWTHELFLIAIRYPSNPAT